MKKLLVYVVLVVIVSVGTAYAQDAASGWANCITKTVMSAATTKDDCVRLEQDSSGAYFNHIKGGNSGFFAIDNATASTQHSIKFYVTDAYADICPGGGAMNGAVAKIHRIISAATNAGSLVPDAETTSTLNSATGDCFQAVKGWYYIEVSTATSSGTTYLEIRGRES